MITVGFIKGGAAGQARVDYYLSRAQLETYPRALEDRDAARERLSDGPGLAGYYGSHTANGPGRWLGRGARALGLDETVADPEAAGRQVSPEQLFTSREAGREWASLARSAGRFATVPASLVGKLARATGGGVDPAGLYGSEPWAHAVAMAAPGRKVDARMAALDVVMSADKSVSLLYATADDATRSLIVSEFHAAVRSALGYLDTLVAVGVRGSRSEGTSFEVGTDGLLAVGFVHDEARPTAGCVCGDPHLHEHVVVLNTARGSDGRWSAVQHDRLAPAAKTAGYLQEAELRARLSARLGVAWRPVVNGLSGVVGITDAQHRQFSKRHDEVAAELAEIGAVGLTAGNAAGRDTKRAKREQLPLAERVAHWQAEAAAVGLTGEALVNVFDRPAASHRPPDNRAPYNRAPSDRAPDELTTPDRAAGDRAAGDRAAGDRAAGDRAAGDRAVLEQLTEQASSFGRPELLRALAQAARQGASVADLTGRADAILTDPTLVVPLAAGHGGLTTGDVRRGPAGRVFAYAVEQKWTTPGQLALEQRLVDAALARAAEGCGRLDALLVEQVIAGQPFVLSDEQAAAVRRLTTSGAGVDVLVAGAGSGKTSAVLGSVRQAYELAGYRVIGAATSAKAARVLADDAGLTTSTVARLLLDLQRPQAAGLGAGGPGASGSGAGRSRPGGLGAGTVLVVDEASMVGTRDMAAVLEHARVAGCKVLVVGDTRQLAAVDAGGGLRALADRLGAQTLTANRRQHAGWERDALAALAAGRPGEALRAYTAHDRVTVTVTDSGLAARRAMVAGWWADVQAHGIQATLLVAVRNTDRAELNRLARDVMRQAGRLGEDQARRRGGASRSGTGWCCCATPLPGATTTATPAQSPGSTTSSAWSSPWTAAAPRCCRLAYTAAGHVDHAYAGTVHKAQGATVVTAHVLGTALARESGYVALSRGRATNRLYLVEGNGHLDVELDLPAPQQRQAYEQAAKTLGASQAKRLALDTSLWGEDAAALHAELDGAARLLRQRPPSDTARLPMLHAEVTRLSGQVDAARTRLAGLHDRLAGLRRRSPDRPALHARIVEQTAALENLQQRLTDTRATVDAAERGTSPAQTWTSQHTPTLSRAVAAGRELSWRSRADDRAATALDPAPDTPEVALMALI